MTKPAIQKQRRIPGDLAITSLRMPEYLKRAISARANREGRSQNDVMIDILERGFKAEYLERIRARIDAEHAARPGEPRRPHTFKKNTTSEHDYEPARKHDHEYPSKYPSELSAEYPSEKTRLENTITEHDYGPDEYPSYDYPPGYAQVVIGGSANES